ncbi:GIY-YIG nuclease family protein [Streptomyces sp. NPDC059340]|uniref:GIY-YIG nuclease family protein n=1 Tax=Streptomyces sp. NPDC059340 TaxID=3346806 RepID=UPI0036833605
MALIDLEDPAFTHIADALAEMKNAGIELDESSVAAAIKLGRHRVSQKNTRVRLPKAREQGDGAGIVYYIRRGAVIKIGTTAQPAKRFATLLPDEVLGFEPGDRALEQERHRQFAHLRVGLTEHFRITPALLEHAQALRMLHGEPDPAWPTLGTLQRPKGRKSLPSPPAPSSPELVTAAEGAHQCGIARNTVQGWAHRSLLQPVGKNDRGMPLYFLDHVLHFAVYSRAHRRTRRTV